MRHAPRQHQQYAYDEAVKKIESGVKQFCISSPTGGGKSLIMQMLCEYGVARDWNVTVLSSRKLLTSQLATGLNEANIHVGIRAAGFESWTDPSAPVQVCAVQTESARVLARREKAMKYASSREDAHRQFSLHPANLVLVDEAHMQKGSRARAILRELQEKHGAVIAGITATPLGIGDIYKELIVAGNMTSLRQCGALVRALCFEPMVMDLGKVYRTKSDVPTQTEMEKAARAAWTQHVVGAIYAHWKEHNPDAKASIGFAPGVKESLGMAQEFWSHGVGAAHISGQGMWMNGKEYRGVDQDDRKEIFEQMRDGKIAMLWNRFVLREAIDLPFVECLSIACPVSSLLSYIQMVGRGLRASPSTGKKECTIIDHCGAVRLHGSPNMDRDKEWQIYFREDEDKITKDRISALRDPDNKEPDPITCPQCKMIRASGSKCPRCGFEHPTGVRLIMQETGKLVASTDRLIPKRKTKIFPNTARLWEQCYWRLRNSKKRDFSFGQVRALFIHDYHYDPPPGLPFMPKHKMDWNRKLKDVPPDRLIPKGGVESNGKTNR